MQHKFPGCYVNSLRHGGAMAPLPTVEDCPPPPTTSTHSNLIPETIGPDKPANEAFPAALSVCLPVCLAELQTVNAKRRRLPRGRSD